MTVRKPIPFDGEALRRAAGDKVFARGEAYAAHGQVQLLSMSEEAILAAAFGTRDYTVHLERPGPRVAGECTCPAYEDSGLCKHMVATALVANQVIIEGAGPPDRIGGLAERIAGLDQAGMRRLLMEVATSDWRMLRALHYSLGLDWDEDFDWEDEWE
jgi:uncharacterized Zn finger protein